jgi:hypothetical protein
MRSLSVLLLAGAAWGQTGIRGVVTNEVGMPLGGALVTATRDAVQEEELAPGRYSSITKADGTFEILGMAVGTYAICSAKEPHEGYVDFCAWTLQPPKVVLTAGVVRTGYRIQLEKGVRMDVVVHDPDGVMHGKAEARKREQLRVAVAGNGLPPNTLYFSLSDPRKAEYFLYVPKRMGVRVLASAEDGDVSGKDEGPGLARRQTGADVFYVEGRETQKVEFRYHRKKEN